MSIHLRTEADNAWAMEARKLFELHRDELTTNKELMKLSPDWQAYATLNAMGKLLVVTAWECGPHEPELVAYSVNVMTRHLHYDLLVCQNDVLYLSPAHRGSRTGVRLIQRTEHEAKVEGAQLMLWHAKPDTTLDRILPRIGCRMQDIVYSKEL